MPGPSAFLLRFAADRWVAAGRPDLYDEWSAELAELSAEGGPSAPRRLAFAASLAVGRVPRPGRVSDRELLAGIGRIAVLVLALLMVPTVALVVGSILLTYPDALVSSLLLTNPMVYVAAGLRLLVLVGLAVVLALAGRAVGRRLPLTLVPGAAYRTTVISALTPSLLVLGMAPVLGLATGGTGSAGPVELVAGLAGWVVVTAVTVPLVLRPLRAGRRGRARLWTLLAALLTLDATVVLVALPRMLPAPGALRSIPFWLPDLLLDGFGLAPLGPSYHGMPLAVALSAAVTPLPLLLLGAAAFGLPYALAAVRSPATRTSTAPAPSGTVAPAPEIPAAVAPAELVVPRRRGADWVLAALGGAAWLVLVGWVTPLADRLTAAGRGGDGVLLTGVFELRTVAVLLTAGALVAALRGTGPAWPAVLTAPALLVVDTLLARGAPGTGAAVTAVLAALMLVAGAAAVVTRLVARPERTYGRWTVPVVGVVAACVAASPVGLGEAAQYARPALVPPVVALGALLGALAARCVVLVRAPRACLAVRAGLTVLGAVPFGAAGLLTASGGGWYQLPAGLGPFAAVLVAVLLCPGRPLPRAGLLLAALPATAVLSGLADFLALLVDGVLPARPGLSHTVLSAVTGTPLVGIGLAAVLLPLLRRRGATPRSAVAVLSRPAPGEAPAARPSGETPTTERKQMAEGLRRIRSAALVVTVVAAVLGALSGIALGSWLSWRDVDRLAPSPAASSAIARAVLPVRADGPDYYGRHTFWNPYSDNTLHGGTGVRVGSAGFSATAPGTTSYRDLAYDAAQRLRAQGYHEVHTTGTRPGDPDAQPAYATVTGTRDGYQIYLEVDAAQPGTPDGDSTRLDLRVMWAAPTSQLAWTATGGLTGALLAALLALWTLRRIRGRSRPARWTYTALCAVTLLLLAPACLGNIPTGSGSLMSSTDRNFEGPSVYWGGFVIYGAEPLAILSVAPLLAILILCAWPRRRPQPIPDPDPTPVSKQPTLVD